MSSVIAPNFWWTLVSTGKMADGIKELDGAMRLFARRTGDGSYCCGVRLEKVGAGFRLVAEYRCISTVMRHRMIREDNRFSLKPVPAQSVGEKPVDPKHPGP